MADWKQITARIRRARGSKDPAGQLTVLFEKTKDAMVAFELGRHFEVVRDPAQALEWYQAAFSRFRRGDWKSKSGEAIVRLGGELPAGSVTKTTADAPASAPQLDSSTVPVSAVSEPALPFRQNSEVFESPVAVGSENPPSGAPALDTASADKKRRRRGRRGGRNRNKTSAVAQQTVDSAVRPTREHHAQRRAAAESTEVPPPRSVDSRSIPRVPVEQLPESLAPGVKGRFGDPGLSSRLSLLEMQLRRLLTCPPAKLDHSEHAPVGPGVFVLTDDDMTTYYHVEACDTLRIAIGTLSRSGYTRRGNPNLKALLGEHLGIAETRVSKYLADHCVVRWLQLDEGAPQFAHFAIAVLRPILNE
jgi:hypothetical protein